MRIIKLVAENVKKLRAIEITPKGDVVQVRGKNESGKSSVLDAIYWALAGKGGVDAKPVREGEEKARITLDLGELIVTRRFTAAGGTSLTVETVDGASYKSPQAVLDKLIGSLAFDPLAFSRMDTKTQLNELRALVPLDIDVDALDAANREDFARRTDLNRELRALASALGVFETEPDEVASVDTDALVDALMAASKTNEDYRHERNQRELALKDIDRCRGSAKLNRDEAARLISAAEAYEMKATNLEANRDNLSPVPADVDVADLRAQIDAAKATNARAVAYADYEKLAVANATLLRTIDDLNAGMDARTAERTAAIARAAMPVAGLSFTEDGVILNGIPFGQASSAQQLRVSCALAMAANPTLRVLRIKDGSLLDDDSLALVAAMAAAHDFQVWVEIVDASGKIGIVMEDGNAREASDEVAS
jgi:hypothetical protein